MRATHLQASVRPVRDTATRVISLIICSMSHVRSVDTPLSAPLETRYVGALAGRYSLRSPLGDATTATVYACRTVSISARSVTVAGPVAGAPGQVVTLLIDHIGFVKGSVVRRVTGGFQVDLDGSDYDRKKRAAKVRWLKDHRVRKVPDKRATARRYPRVSAASLRLPDGSLHPCFLIDVSSTGAGISATLRPPIGTRLAIGTVAAVVVRHMEAGFGVAFEAPPSDGRLEAELAAR